MHDKYIPESILDFVLAVMNQWESGHPNAPQTPSGIMQLIQETSDAEKGYITPNNGLLLFQILNKLYNDKLIDYVPASIEDVYATRCYFVTFEGGMAFHYGHYVQKRINDGAESIRVEALEKNQMANASRMTYLTVILAVFAFLSVFLQFVPNKDAVREFLHLRMELKSCVIVLFFGIVAGILLAIAAQELVGRKSK